MTLASVLCAAVAVVFGLLIDMDTAIEVNPNGDRSLREEAVGLRAFAWGLIAVFVGLLTAGVVTGWRARAHARPKAALLLSLIAAVPIFLAALGFLILSLGNSA